MNATTIATVVLAVCAVMGIVAAVTAWFFKRGADEREYVVALRESASATRDLIAEFREFKDHAVGEMHLLDIRITKLEAPLNGNHRSPTH